ncbi:MAG: hypothetical protein DBX37_01630 [Massilioclostridium sp.]|nr:MAG: hypothetical protein DBX37_01630 [Massilioclostridium sp.]
MWGILLKCFGRILEFPPLHIEININKFLEGENKVMIWIVLIIAVGIFLLILWMIVQDMLSSKEIEVKEEEKTSNEESPIEKKNAIVVDKTMEDVIIGSYHIPERYLDYKILFQFDDGEQKWFSVTEDIYDDISVNEYGELITAEDDFLDFNNRYGEEISSENKTTGFD